MDKMLFVLIFFICAFLFGLFLRRYIYRREIDAQDLRTSAIYVLLMLAVIYALYSIIWGN